MANDELAYLTIAELAERIRSKAVSPVEVTRATLDRIERLDQKLNAFITVLADSALATAKQSEQRAQRGELLGPLDGVPVALKDLFDVAGVKTTCASKIMADYVPTEDGEVTRRFKAAGAVIVGKLNLHEFAFGPTSTSPHYGPVHNPWDLERITGGSSGGSGAATAAGLAYATTGTDTGGSIRIPAAVCGIFGHKPTYGRVSRRGIFPLAWSLDHGGPMTRTVRDSAIVMNAISGYDPRDPASADVPVPDFTSAFGQGVKGLRVGIPRGYFYERLDPSVERCVEASLTTLKELGVELVEIDFPGARLSGIASTIVLFAEAAAVHDEWLRTRRHDYGPDVRGRLVLGKFMLATDYVNAQRARTLLIRELQSIMHRVDVLVTPVMPIPVPRLDEKTATTGGSTEDVRAALTRFTRAFNLTGSPTGAVPCGFTDNGTPVGIQVVGRAFADDTVLRVCHAYEQATEWHKRRPPL
ncbi:MAG: Asp-tRNA(Asn)/Glu-tRNA(Gln) amidotransferase subunit GatA [Chloroflexi bacterium]|nr:Asp-tRNA(Asn)/Glu-tRNA(Gln) amidotransferase subunit GatA [Chloroflexota bacterium]